MGVSGSVVVEDHGLIMRVTAVSVSGSVVVEDHGPIMRVTAVGVSGCVVGRGRTCMTTVGVSGCVAEERGRTWFAVKYTCGVSLMMKGSLWQNG